jgi:hypothetical protein
MDGWMNRRGCVLGRGVIASFMYVCMDDATSGTYIHTYIHTYIYA